MPKIRVLEPFKFAHHGYQVEEFEPSDEPRATTDECAEIAVREGWAELVEEPTKKQSRPTRKQLDAALKALPGDYTDATLVVDGMREHFGDLFTDADEARVRELVKVPS